MCQEYAIKWIISRFFFYFIFHVSPKLKFVTQIAQFLEIADVSNF